MNSNYEDDPQVIELNLNKVKIESEMNISVSKSELVIRFTGDSFPLKSSSCSSVGVNKLLKKPLTIEQLVEKLKLKGITMTDEESLWAIQVLKEVNYYSLSLFAKIQLGKLYERSPDIDRSFTRLMEIYRFDEFLRKSLSTLIAPIEEYLRASVANVFSCYLLEQGVNFQCAAQPYLYRKLFKPKAENDRYLKKMENTFYITLARNLDREPSLQHYVQQYDGYIPIWVLVEHLTLGNISEFLNLLTRNSRDILIRDRFTIYENGVEFKITGPKQFPKFVTVIKMVRNICAHNGRVYAKTLNFVPDFTKISFPDINIQNDDFKKRFFGWLLVIRCFYRFMTPERKTEWNVFVETLAERIHTFKINTRLLGLPAFVPDQWFL